MTGSVEQHLSSLGSRLYMSGMRRLLLFTSVFASLQAAPGQTPPFPAERRCVFTCLSWDEAAGPLHYRTLVKDPKAPVYFTVDKPVPLVMGTGSTSVPSGFRSDPQSYLGPAVLEFFPIPPPSTLVAKELMPEPVARVFLPPLKARLVLVFFKQTPPRDQPSLLYRVEVLPDGLDEVAMGGYLLVNTTSKKMIGAVDTTAFELEPRSHRAIKSPADKEQNLEWRFWKETKKERPIYSSVWNHRPGGRSIIFITDSTDQRSALTVRAIQEDGAPAMPKVEPPPVPR